MKKFLVMLFIFTCALNAQVSTFSVTFYDSTDYVNGGGITPVTTATNLQTLVSQPLFVSAEWDSIDYNVFYPSGDTASFCIGYRKLAYDKNAAQSAQTTAAWTAAHVFGAFSSFTDTVVSVGAVVEKTKDIKNVTGNGGWVQLMLKFQTYSVSAVSYRNGVTTGGKPTLTPFHFTVTMKRRQ